MIERPKIETAVVASGGEDVFAQRVRGGGRGAVVFSHGAGGSHAVWFQQVPVLVDAGYDVVIWDSRGFGNSTYSGGPLSPGAGAGDLALVLDRFGIDEVHLVAQSMGGWWNNAFALADPERVRSHTLGDTPGGAMTPAMTEHFAAFRRAGGLGVNDDLGRHTALCEATCDERPEVAFLYQQLGSFFTPPMAAIGQALFDTTVDVAELAAASFPKQVIAGTDDQIFPARLLAELADAIDARYVEIAGAGHSPYFEQPEPFNAALLEFLDTVEAG